MTVQDLLNKISNLPERPHDTPTVPPAEVVAFVVRWNRGLRQWKTTTLADFARVSVSTVERIERGEKVSVEALDRVAQAFGYEAGYFTAPRDPLPAEQAATELADTFSRLEPVPVTPMRTHRAIREAARCDAFLVHRPDVPANYDTEIDGLAEWLDLASFVLSDFIDRGDPAQTRRRELYNGILKCVIELERRGLTVLVGVMQAPQDGYPDWKVAVISITTKLKDPGATKRQHLMVDRRAVAFRKPPVK
jgi:transcriptional regulator with XRE-family HTH domain